jgi:hypothetical protein
VEKPYKYMLHLHLVTRHVQQTVNIFQDANTCKIIRKSKGHCFWLVRDKAREKFRIIFSFD